MPKKLNFENPVRLLREALKLTQPKFATSLGISVSYLRKVELGEKKFGDQLAAVIAIRYGVEPASLKAARGRPRFMSRKARSARSSTAERVAAWADFASLFEASSTATFEEFLLPKIRLLIASAVTRGQGIFILDALDRAVMKTANDFGLTLLIKSRIRERDRGEADALWIPYLVYAGGRLAIQNVPNLEVCFELNPASSPGGKRARRAVRKNESAL